MFFDSFFKKMSVRSKLLYGYSFIFLLLVAMVSLVLYFSYRQILEQNIESELKNSTLSILNMVKIAANSSIRSNLKGIAETNLNMVRHQYNDYTNGLITEEAAKNNASKQLLSQLIGRSGYIYTVNSAGVIQIHPQEKLQGADLSTFSFIQTQKAARRGYIEYEWANPGELDKRGKVLYMTYFEPWDWIISVSAYRDEIKDLFSIDDFKKSILSLTFGKTGYSFVIDSKGNLIIHPKLQGQNIYDSRDSSGRKFIKELCERKNGKIIYPWENPGEDSPRNKLVVFNYIEELDWIVASSSYLEEFYGPLTKINYVLSLTAFFTLVLLVLMTWLISASISQPLGQLIDSLASGVDGDLSGRVKYDGGGELGYLACYFNSFMDDTEKSKLELLASEEKYRAIFEHAVGGIFQIDFQGVFLNLNPSMAKVLGYATPQKLLNEVTNFFDQHLVHPEHKEDLLGILAEYGTVERFETRLYKRDRRQIWVSINARAIKNELGELASFEGLLMDVTERKAAEEILTQSRSELEQRVKDRTNELSCKIEELEQRNLEISVLHEMGEMIQVCQNNVETYPIISNYLRKIFPDDAGAIFLFNSKTVTSNPIVTWGGYKISQEPFSFTDCWGIRHGKPYIVDGPGSKVYCNHVSTDRQFGYLCIPMIVNGDINGLFHLEFRQKEKGLLMLQSRQHRKQVLAGMISEQLTLAIANLSLRERLRQQSVQDPLTGLYNRRHMEKYIERESLRAKRHGTILGILMADIDHFKKVNDIFGHVIGDQVLKNFGTFLNSNIRLEDMACRYGGEEFVVILADTSLEAIAQKAEFFRKGAKEKLHIDHYGKTAQITISIGVAAYPVHGAAGIHETMLLADQALYQAKEQGRDCMVMATTEST